MTHRVQAELELKKNILNGNVRQVVLPAGAPPAALLGTAAQARNLEEDLLLGGEGGVEGALGETGGRCDIADGGPLVALGGEDAPGRLEQQLTPSLLADPPPPLPPPPRRSAAVLRERAALRMEPATAS